MFLSSVVGAEAAQALLTSTNFYVFDSQPTNGKITDGGKQLTLAFSDNDLNKVQTPERGDSDSADRQACVQKQGNQFIVATFPKGTETGLDSPLGAICGDSASATNLRPQVAIEKIEGLGKDKDYSILPKLTTASTVSLQLEVSKGESKFTTFDVNVGEASVASLLTARAKGLKNIIRVYQGIGKQTIPVKGTPTETNVALIWFRDDLVQQDLVDLKVVTGTKEKTVTDALLAFATAAPAAVFETAAASVDVYQAADGKATAILCPKHDKDLATVEEKQPLFFIKKEDGSVAPEQIALNTIKDVTKEPGLASADIDRTYGCSSATFNKPGKYLVTYEAALKDSNPNSLMSYLKREASGSGGAVLPEYGTEREAIRIIVRSQSERFLQSKPGERVLTLVKPVAATSTPKVTLYATKAFQESMEQAGLTFETGADGKKTVSLYVPEFDTSNEKMYEAFAGTDYLDAFTKLTNEGEKKKFWGVLDRYADEKTINSFLKKHLDEGPTVF
ncbi:hypothetical protein HZC09_04805, partial [Candidatus Micrarchaeota archaeon]|nr:hypothetical protein [Candidatus Micrarchaeota archaeon]